MPRPLFLLLLFLFSTQLLDAQPYGLILDDDAYEETPLVEKSPDRGSGPIFVDLRPYCPVPGDQGNLPSCVAWSLANGLTIQYALAQRVAGQNTIEKKRFSVAYIYNQIIPEGNCQQGANYKDGLELLLNQGACPADMLSYSQDCNPHPGPIHHAQALPNRIRGYRRVFDIGDTPTEKVQRILDELARNRPVLIAIRVPDQFRKIIPGPNDPWPGKHPHAMLVVGYHELLNKFILMNSYGPEWGQDGYFEMSFTTLGEQVRYGYILMP